MMNDIERICQAIRSAAYEEALAERLGLNATDLRCLELTIGEPGLTAGRLADLSRLTTGAVTGVLDRLENAGFVDRRPDPDDRRSVTIHPSPARAAELRKAGEPLEKAIRALLARSGAGEREAIGRFLDAAMEIVAAETARFRAATRGGFLGDRYEAPVGDTARGRLIFVSGAPRLSLNVAPLGPQAAARVIVETSASRLAFAGAAPAGDLIRATFDGPTPDIRTSGGTVTIRYRRTARSAFQTRKARIALSAGIPWTIELRGGLTDLDGSLEGVTLSRVDVEDGANHINLDLPAAAGTVAIRVSGLASSVRLRRPASTPVGLRVAGGISHLRLDGRHHQQVGGEQRFVSDRSKAGADRYEVEILGGASEVRIDAG
jgi:DNA-binding MarR family transcriptional regulator